MNLSRLPFALLALIFLAACHSDNMDTKNQETSDVVGTWKLTQIVSHSMIAGEQDQANPPKIEEFYKFNADNTFKRYRANGYEATGRYAIKQVSETESGIVLTFDSKDLCYHEVFDTQLSHPQEVYMRFSGTVSLSESYIASDGPTYKYEKVPAVE